MRARRNVAVRDAIQQSRAPVVVETPCLCSALLCSALDDCSAVWLGRVIARGARRPLCNVVVAMQKMEKGKIYPTDIRFLIVGRVATAHYQFK